MKEAAAANVSSTAANRNSNRDGTHHGQLSASNGNKPDDGSDTIGQAPSVTLAALAQGAAATKPHRRGTSLDNVAS